MKIMIDTGVTPYIPCRGRAEETVEESPVLQIGTALNRQLEQMGYETLLSGMIPELNDLENCTGRQNMCAAIARRWGADCVLSLGVRASKLPSVGTAEAMVFRRNSDAWELAQSILQRVTQGSELTDQGIRPSSGIVLLRRMSGSCVMLILRLPFFEKENFTIENAFRYAELIARGIDGWAGKNNR